MPSSDLSGFLAFATAGRMNRRQVLERGLGLGVSTAMLTTLCMNAPEASAAAGATTSASRFLQADKDPATCTVIFTSGVTDCDPHSNYSTYGAVVTLACYDMLINYKDLSTTEYEPMLAESWTASEDLTTYTFKIRANAVFHDGTPCDAQAVKDSMVRFRRLE